MRSRADLLILGLGNLLYGDDGLGVVAAGALAAAPELPPGVRVLDGGTLGLSLLPWLDGARRVLLLDAVRSPGAPPGTLVRLERADVPPAVRERLSPHQIGVADLLDGAALLGNAPEEIVLLGLVPASLAFGVGLSPAVAFALPGLVDAALRHAAAPVPAHG